MTDSASSSTDGVTFPAVQPVPAGRFRGGRLRPPGSKSLTQRYLDLALVHPMPLELRWPLLSEDTEHFLAGLETTGVSSTIAGDTVDGGTVRLIPGEVPGEGATVHVFCGAGGTMFRFLTAALATRPGIYHLDGIPRLRERTVAPLLDALRQLGAQIDCPDEEGFAPLVIAGRSLDGGRAVLDAGVSSQFLSALLIAGLAARRTVEIEVAALTSEPYVDLTLDAVAELGGKIDRDGRLYRVHPGPLSAPAGGAVEVEADFSSAAYPAAAAALCGPRVVLDGLRQTSRQGDRGFLEILERMGARVRWRDDGVEIEGGELRAVDMDLSAIPDQVPTLASLAPFARGTTRIRNVAHLRIKESDRLAAMALELSRLGAEVEELEDGLVLPGVWADAPPPRQTVEVETHGDHRIAMSLALVGLRRPGVVVRDPGVVAKSYPAFWDAFQALLAAD